MTDNPDTNLDRRTLLKRGAVGAFGVVGTAATGVGASARENTGWSARDTESTAQDEPERSRYTRRVALPYPERLDGGPVRKILLLTDRTDDDPDVSEVDACGFSNWPTEALTVWEGIVVDWENAVGDLGFGTSRGTPTVRANRLVEIETIYVDEQATPVELGTAYIVNGVVDCPGEFRGLTAEQLPGVQIRTGPGVSTEG